MAKNILDTSLIIQFLTNEDPKRSLKVKKLLSDKRQENILPDVVVTEIITILSADYGLTKEKIIPMIVALINIDTVDANQHRLERTLALWERSEISFIDAYLATTAMLDSLILYSYDSGLDQIKFLKRKEP